MVENGAVAPEVRRRRVTNKNRNRRVMLKVKDLVVILGVLDEVDLNGREQAVMDKVGRLVDAVTAKAEGRVR